MKYLTSASNYEKTPHNKVIHGHDNQMARYYQSICERIKSKSTNERTIVCVDCHIGVDQRKYKRAYVKEYPRYKIIHSDDISMIMIKSMSCSNAI